MNNDPNEIAADPKPDRAPGQTPEEQCDAVEERWLNFKHTGQRPSDTLRAFYKEALAAKDEELKQCNSDRIAQYEQTKLVAGEADRLRADLAAERAKREANDLHCQNLADEVLAERDAAIQRAEQAEARLAAKNIALDRIADSGGQNFTTTGEGHAKCVAIAKEALK